MLFYLFSGHLFAQWTQQVSGTANQLTDVFFTDLNNGAACSISGTILRTTNGGVNWITQPNGLGVNLWGIYLINASTGMVIGDGTVARTTNGGTNWISITPPTGGLFRGITFSDQNSGYIDGSGGVLIGTTNGGANWTTLNTGSTEQLYDPGFANVNTGFITGANGTIIKTTNAGQNWSALNSGITTDLYGTAVINIDTIYAAGDAGKILKTINGGATWVQQTNGTGHPLFDVHFINSTTGTAVGENTVLRTTNGGLEWISQDPGISSITFIGVQFTTVTTGYGVGSGGTIIYTTTGGFTLPLAANLTLPANGAQNVSLTPLLKWDTLANAKTYDLQLATDSLFTSNIIDSTLLINTQLPVAAGRLTNNTRYYWRVRGVNIVGNGPWSSIFHFTTVVALPNAPVLLLPINNASNVSLTPSFDWDSTSPALYYRLQVSSDSLFNGTPEVDQTGILTSNFTLVTPPLHSNTRFYWRVAATNAAGTGPWSNVSRFTTIITIPEAPILVSPPNNSNGIPLAPTLDWRDDITATSYQIQLSADSLFATSLVDTTVTTQSQVTIRPGLLVNLVKYYWRVRTTNSIGTGPYSNPWNFTTGLTPPAVPVLRQPPNGATDISTDLTFDWDNVPFADTYKIQIATDSLFTAIIISAGDLTVSQYTTPNGILQNNTTYYWRVNATNSSGTGNYSAVWHFRTVISAPIAPPDLISPSNGSIITTFTPVLDWNDVSGTTGYKVQLSVDSLFIAPILDSIVVPSQITVPVGRLIGSTKYYWRVRGMNVGGFGPWSVVWNFTTSPIGITLISTIIPKECKLYNNYPNPFNPSTRIRFDLPKTSEVSITVYDLLGRQVSTLLNMHLNAGTYETVWNSANVASGLYFYRIETGDFIETHKMLLVK